MKILFALSSIPVGGMEVFTVDLAKKLKALNNDVRMLVFKPVSEEMDSIASGEIKIKIFSAGRRSRFDFSFLGKTQKHMKEFNPDIIVSLSGFTYFFVEFLQQFSGRTTPHIMAFHSLRPYGFKEKFFSELVIFFSKLWKGYYLFTSSKQLMLNVEYYNIAKEKTFMVHNAVDAEFFAHPAPREEKKQLNIIHVANIVAEKDQWTLLKALDILNRNLSDWKLTFVGKDKINLLADFKEYLNRINLSEKVIFTRCSDRVELKKLLSTADIFVLTSVSEVLPVSALEALSMGIPCILTDVGGCPEIITDGYNGYLVKPKDPAVVADKIRLLSENRSLLRQMSANARKTVLEKFTLDFCAGKYMETFNAVARIPDKTQ